tara:strand:- start:395 stop:574 length:180 start_codon:yes stop_codon:yes gene_type:complete
MRVAEAVAQTILTPEEVAVAVARETEAAEVSQCLRQRHLLTVAVAVAVAQMLGLLVARA